MKINKPLITILLTVALDIIWLWFILPALPFVVKNFWYWEFFVWLAFWVFSLWMLLWWLIFWRLSDIYWRKNILRFTVLLNLLWYIIFAFSPNIWFFILWRLLSWFGWAWWSIWQAYISDISNEKDRTKNMWLIWATFGIWFVIWPLFWALINTESMFILWIIPAIVIFINLLMIQFFLPETPKKLNDNTKEDVSPIEFHQNKKQIYLMFLITFITAVGFSWLQSTFSLLMADRFWFGQNIIWYLFVYIWICSIIYQVLWIKHIRKFFNEKYMVIIWFSALAISFLAFALNNYSILIFLIIPIQTFWMWNIHPSVWSLIAKKAWDEVWKALWTNGSSMSLWNIIWAIIAWYFYTIWSWLPYLYASILFLWMVVITYIFVKQK